MSLVNDYLKQLGHKSVASVKNIKGGVPPVLRKQEVGDSHKSERQRKITRYAIITIAVYTVGYCIVTMVSAFQKPAVSESVTQIGNTSVTSQVTTGAGKIASTKPAPLAAHQKGTRIDAGGLNVTSVTELPQVATPEVVKKYQEGTDESALLELDPGNVVQRTTQRPHEGKTERLLPKEEQSHVELHSVVAVGAEIVAPTDRTPLPEGSGRKIFFEESNNTSAYYYQIALQAQHDKQLGRAEFYYRNTLQEEPTHENALVNLAAIYIQEERLQEAQVLLRKVRNINPDNSKALVNQGMIELQSNRLETAGEFFRQALERNPIEESALGNLAYLAAQRNKYDDASFYYDKLLQISPGTTDVLLAYAALEEKKRQFTSAIKLYQQCLAQLGRQTDPRQHEKIRRRIQLLKQFASQQK